jgi:hypothetical protein
MAFKLHMSPCPPFPEFRLILRDLPEADDDLMRSHADVIFLSTPRPFRLIGDWVRMEYYCALYG